MKTLNPNHPIRNSLKHLALASMMAASIAMMPSSANAAPITWGTATTIADDLDVSTTGTFKYAYHWASGNQTVNGVTFTGTNSTTAGGGDVGLSSFDANYFAFTSDSNPFASLSTAYKATLAGSNYNSGATVTVTLKNLTVGKQYEAQVWIEDARNEPNSRFATLTSVSGNSVILDFNSTGASGGLGQHSIGTFTANAATQTFTIAPSAGGSAQLNALQVRDLGASTATLSPTFSPEAGTYYGAQTVTLECATAGATIYYTTNGDTPNNTSSSGSSGLTVNVPVGTTMTINAYASAAGSSDSDIISATYTTLPIVSGTWTNSDGGPWTTATNWQDDAIAIGVGGTASFSTLTLPANTTVSLDGAKTIGNLIFDDLNATKFAWTLNTGSGGPLTLAVASGTPTVTSNAPTTIGAVLTGTQGLQKEGSNVLTLTAANTYTGTTAVNNGTLVYQNTYASASHVIASGATLEFNVPSGIRNGATTTFTGAGSFVKSGNGELLWGIFGTPGIATFAMNAGSLIDVQAGKLTIGSFADDFMTNCKADLNVAAAATFNSAACDAFVDALTGSGTIILAYTNSLQRTMTVGVDNGSGTFSGALTNGPDGGNGRVVKTGSGTQTLSGTNLYTGETTVNQGTLAVTGSLAATAVTVSSPATLAGNGNIGGNVTIASGARHALAVAATTGAQVTRAITGTLTLTAGNILDLTAASTPADGVYVLATATTAITGTPTTINYNGITNGTISVDTASSPKQLLLTVSSSLYATWANGTFTTPLTAKLPTDNQDGDSLNNLQEYAFGTQPTVSTGEIVYSGETLTTPGTPKIVAAAGTYSMVFGRRADYVAAGLTYTVQFSAGLDTWVDNVDGTNPPVQVATDSTINAMSVPFVDFITTPSGSQKPTFARVKVVQAP